MTDLKVIEPRTNKERNQFLNCIWDFYQGDPNWIPPLRMDQKEMVGYSKNPFYDENRIKNFIAVKNGKTVGRISAIWNKGHLDRYQDGVGFFGFYDSIDDQETADALFDTAGDWLRSLGVKVLRGPMNPSMNNTLGLLIDGFDTPPFFMMTYNPPFYEKLFENYGFKKCQDLYSFWGEIEMLPKVREKYLHICEMIQERHQAVVRPLDTKHFQRDVELFLDVYNRSMTNTWGFVPFSPAELKHMAGSLKWLIVPELALGVELEGKLVGATFGLPDYNPRIKEISGSLFPFGFLHLLRHKERIKKIRVISTNVLPEYQMLGLGLVLLNALVPKVMEWGIKEAEFSWVLESNEFSRGSLEKAGAIRNKTYRVYDKNL